METNSFTVENKLHLILGNCSLYIWNDCFTIINESLIIKYRLYTSVHISFNLDCILVYTVEAMMNVNLDRYKGLGEMDGEQLGESALRII